MNDYLFDKEGDPDGDADREVERLESLLGPLAYRGVAPRLPVRRTRRTFFVVGAASALAAAALVALVIAKPWRPSWAATVRDGVATRDGHTIAGATRLPVGAWLETQTARVQLVVADIGIVELAPQTRARVVTTGATRHELELQRGTIVATIDAPPRHFVVTTPRAVVTDLGCAFELTVDESGRGQLVVTAGKVAVSSGGAPEVVVPAGARVELSERGAGVPYVPAAERPSPPAPPPQPVPPQPSKSQAPTAVEPHAAKPTRHPTHATKAQPAAHPISKMPTPSAPAAHAQPPHAQPPHAQPPRKPETGPKIEHDALKDLKNSVE